MDYPDLTAQTRSHVRLSLVLVAVAILGLATGATSAEAAIRKTFLISPTSIDFGNVAVGTTSPQQSVTITNVSTAPVIMSGAGGAAGVFGGSQNCQGTTLNPGQSCQMFFAFTPTALGPATGASNGTWNGQSFTITFTGTGTRLFLISPTSIDFGNVAVGTTSPQQSVTITNVSASPVVMSGAGGAAGVFG